MRIRIKNEKMMMVEQGPCTRTISVYNLDNDMTEFSLLQLPYVQHWVYCAVSCEFDEKRPFYESDRMHLTCTPKKYQKGNQLYHLPLPQLCPEGSFCFGDYGEAPAGRYMGKWGVGFDNIGDAVASIIHFFWHSEFEGVGYSLQDWNESMMPHHSKMNTPDWQKEYFANKKWVLTKKARIIPAKYNLRDKVFNHNEIKTKRDEIKAKARKLSHRRNASPS